MTQEEILQYNKRCAEFLGWKKCLTNEFDNYGYCQTVDGYESPFKNIVANPQILEYNYSEFQHSISDLQFHSDWNWIMEVVEAIKNLQETVGSGKGTKMVTKFDITNNSVTIAFENGDFYDAIHVGHTDSGRYFKMEGDVDTPKEAVVEAINQFLIWYEQNKTI